MIGGEQNGTSRGTNETGRVLSMMPDMLGIMHEVSILPIGSSKIEAFSTGRILKRPRLTRGISESAILFQKITLFQVYPWG
jgi:hypothetical protein